MENEKLITFEIGDYFIYNHPTDGLMIGIITIIEKETYTYNILYEKRTKPLSFDWFGHGSIWHGYCKRITKEVAVLWSI